MQQNVIDRKEVDWERLRQEVVAYAGNPQATRDTYPAIAYACSLLARGLCSLREPAETSSAIQQRSANVESAARASEHGRRLTGRAMSPYRDRGSFVFKMLVRDGRQFAYIVVPFCGTMHSEYRDARLRHQWAEDLFALVNRGSLLGAQGWILDLRGNSGGYLGPMLAGIQSLIGDTRVLNLRGPGVHQVWSIRRGSVMNRVAWNHVSVEAAIAGPLVRKEEASPVAVLVDRGTRAAGEALAIAFRGRPRTWFLGEQTAGEALLGSFWELSDGAVLAVMSERVLDRAGHSYEEGVKPDGAIEEPRTVPALTEDAAVLAAEEWLLRQ